jgi:hypothetical protein
VGSESIFLSSLLSELRKIVDKIPKTVFGAAGIYGPEYDKAVIEGNVMVAADGILLRNMEIKGDLLMADTVAGEGVQLYNVAVAGRTIIHGEGLSSIILENFYSPRVTVKLPEGQKIRLAAAGTTDIELMEFNSDGIIEEVRLTGEGFKDIRIDEGREITFIGDSDRFDLNGDGVRLFFPQGAVETLNLNGSAFVSGQGRIVRANVHADDICMEQRPDQVNIQEGCSAVIGGIKLTGPIGYTWNDTAGSDGGTSSLEPPDTDVPSGSDDPQGFDNPPAKVTGVSALTRTATIRREV